MIIRRIYFLLFVNIFYKFCVSEQDHLEFDSIDKANALIYSISLVGSVNLDAYPSNQILLQNYRNYETNFDSLFSYKCQVKGLSDESQIEKAELCYKSSVESNEVCYSVLGTDQLELKQGLSVKIDKNLKTGFLAKFNLKDRYRSNNGLYFCKISNNHHSIISNFVELENVAFEYLEQLEHITTVDATKNIKITTNSPFSLHCGKNAYPDTRKSFQFDKSPFYWVLWKQYDESAFPPVNNYMEYVQFANGTMEILRFRKTRARFTLACKSYLVQKFYSLYNIEIDIQSNSAQYSSQIIQVSPKMTKLTLREGPIGIKKNFLTAFYYSNPFPLKSTSMWKKNDVAISNVYPDALWNNFNFMFPTSIDSTSRGRYSLLIDQQEPKDQALFEFDVDVISVPKFKDNPFKVLYRIAGQPAKFSAEIVGETTSAEIFIDNVLIPFDRTNEMMIESKMNFDSNNKELQLMVPNVSTNLTSPKSDADSKEKKVTSRFKRIYTISFVASTKFASSRLSHLLKVYDFPQLSLDIKELDCPTMDGLYNITYVTNTDQYVKSGLVVNHIWTFFDLKEKPVDTNQFVTVANATIYLKKNDTLSGLLVQYRLQIFEPQQPNAASNLIFDSALYPSLVKSFKTRLSCTVKTAEFPIYVVAIVVGLLMCILIVIILVLCMTRSKGETYNIDKNERAMGHDPEAECRENEVFLNYERQNDDEMPTKGSRLSLTNDSVGENSNGGELDYGIDTASYSEEGSFIGQYSTNSKTSSKPSEQRKDSQV